MAAGWSPFETMATRRPATQINARQKVLLANLQACGDEMSDQQLHRSLEPEQAMGLATVYRNCLLYTSPSPRDATLSRMPSSA